MEAPEEYLVKMLRKYHYIRESGLILYVARTNPEHFEGCSVLFALPDTRRRKKKSGEIELTKDDYLYLLEKKLYENFVEEIERRNMKVYLFEEPEKRENLNLKSLEEISNEGYATLWQYTFSD